MLNVDSSEHPQTESPPRVMVYVDGFNLYHGVLRDNPQWKWLNLERLFDALRPHEKVIGIRYFTAILDEAKPVSERRDRQKRYLKALESLSRVRIIKGKFQSREVTCRASCRQTYSVPEEKKTDVNLALEMVGDAMRGAMERIVLVSGDSDLEPAIQWVRTNYPAIKVAVYIPQLPGEAKNRRNDSYMRMGAEVKALPLETFSHHQMPREVQILNGRKVIRPESWA